MSIGAANKPQGENDMAIVRTTKGLRDFLFEQLAELSAGEINASHARAVAKFTAQIIASKNLEIQYAQMGSSKETSEVEL